MSMKVLQALHTLLGATVQKQPRRRGSVQDAEVGPQTPQGGPLNREFVQAQRKNPTLQGGNYNPGLTPLQGSRNVRPIQGGIPWYDN